MFAPHTVEKVVCHLLRFGSSRADADDLAQEALLIAWRERDQLDPARSVDAWLYGIARNVYRNHARRQRRSPIAAGDLPADAADHALAPGDVLALHRALQALPENQQDIVILHQLEGHTLKETAELLGIPFDTAKDRLRRARATLETACGPALDDHAAAESTSTHRTAKAAVAAVLAGLLAATARPGAATAATALSTKLLVAAALVGGIVVGAVGHRMLSRRPAPSSTSAPVASAGASAPAPTADLADAAPGNTDDGSTPPAITAVANPRGATNASVGGGAPNESTSRTAASHLDAETAMLDEARAALRAGRAADAARTLRQSAQRFPAGQLAEERDLLAMEAELALDHRDRIRVLVERFRAAYPASIHAARVDAIEATGATSAGPRPAVTNGSARGW